MKRFKRVTSFLCLMLVLVSMFAMPVFATDTGDDTIEVMAGSDTGDAISDIMEGDRFRGAMSSIKWLTDLIDHYFIQIISVVSFFIISAALLKNVCAGAYCANSKFWDKVDDAHKKTEAITLASVKGYFQGGQGVMNTSAGGIRDFILGIIPNIKAFTDFEDADIEPKAYFMKAIPQMIACVMIGVFIYNGYYRDTASKVGDMGAVVIEKTLNSVDPESLVNAVFNMTSWPDFAWKGDTSLDGKANLKIAESFKSLVASNFGDVDSSEDKAYVVNQITNFVDDLDIASITSTAPEGYVYKISGVSSYVAAGDAQSEALRPISGEQGKSDLVFLCKQSMSTFVGATTQMTTDNQYGYVRFTLKLDVADATDMQASGVTAEVANSEKQNEAANLITTASRKFSDIVQSGLLDFTNHTANGYITLKSISIDASEFGIDATQYRYTSPNGNFEFADKSFKSITFKGGTYGATKFNWDGDTAYITIGTIRVEGSEPIPLEIAITQ